MTAKRDPYIGWTVVGSILFPPIAAVALVVYGLWGSARDAAVAGVAGLVGLAVAVTLLGL